MFPESIPRTKKSRSDAGLNLHSRGRLNPMFMFIPYKTTSKGICFKKNCPTGVFILNRRNRSPAVLPWPRGSRSDGQPAFASGRRLFILTKRMITGRESRWRVGGGNAAARRCRRVSARRICELRQREHHDHRGQALFQKSFHATTGRTHNGKSSRAKQT